MVRLKTLPSTSKSILATPEPVSLAVRVIGMVPLMIWPSVMPEIWAAEGGCVSMEKLALSVATFPARSATEADSVWRPSPRLAGGV